MGELWGQLGELLQKFSDAVAWTCHAIASIVRGIAIVCRHPVWGMVRGLNYRYRELWPPFAILGFLIVGWLLADGASPLGVGVACLLFSAITVFYLRKKADRAQEWAYMGICLGGATLGLLLTSLVGTQNNLLNGLGVVGWAVLSGIWWRHHEVRGVDHVRSPFVALWNEHIRDGKGPMAGAELAGPVSFEHGETYTVRVVPYKQTLNKAINDLPNWTTALDTPMQYMVLEQHPDHPKSPRYLRLQRITDSPIEKTLYYDRPRYEKGSILLGPYADGVGEAKYRLYTENSMWGGFGVGGIGSGKSRLIDSIVIGALAMRNVGMPTVVFYADGQDGASSPALFANATWAVGPEGSRKMLGALERIVVRRNKENRAWGISGFTPSEDRPGILVVIDEAHEILPKDAKRWSRVARTGRKLGVAILAADQYTGLADVFGNEEPLRSSLLAGNGFGLRTTSRIAQHLIPGLNFDLYDLPILPGFGYAIAAKGSDARTAPFRGRFLPDEEYAVDHPEVPVETVEVWYELYPPLELDVGAARAAGPDYTQRHETAEQERAELLRELSDDDALERELEALVEAETDAELKSIEAQEEPVQVDEQSTTCALQIQALDWDGLGEMQVAQVMTHLPGTKLSTVRKALDKLAGDEYLVKDTSQSRRVVYRRK